MPDDWASWMLVENRKDILSEVQSSTLFVDSTKADISLLDSKIEKLMNAYLENALSLEEYRDMKNKLVNEKQLLKEKISAFGRKSNNRFELAIAFLKEANQAEKYAQQENPERIRDFLKKIGSNFRIADRTLACDFKNAFQIAGKYHAEALCAEAVSYDFTKSENWRRDRDSNPGRTFILNGFQDRRLKPLSHLSVFNS